MLVVGKFPSDSKRSELMARLTEMWATRPKLPRPRASHRHGSQLKLKFKTLQELQRVMTAVDERCACEGNAPWANTEITASEEEVLQQRRRRHGRDAGRRAPLDSTGPRSWRLRGSHEHDKPTTTLSTSAWSSDHMHVNRLNDTKGMVYTRSLRHVHDIGEHVVYMLHEVSTSTILMMT